MTKKSQSYQELKQSLDTTVAKLQHEDTDIDEALVLYKEAQSIIKELDEYLAGIADKAEIDIKKLN